MMRKYSAVVILSVILIPSVLYASDTADYEIYESRPSFSPYYAGKVKPEVLHSALDELNYIRSLIGVPANVSLDDEYTQKAQHASVLLDAIGRLDHTPAKPSDMSEEFYALGYAGTSSSNLAWGTSLQGSISLYMDDSDSGNISRLGHRRWLMNPKMTHTGFGVSVRGKFSAAYVFQRGGSLRDFVEGVLGRTYNENETVVLTPDEMEIYHQWEEEQKQWPVSGDFISWPTCRNPHPLYYFDANTAWCVVLNGNIFASFTQTGTDGISVKLVRENDGMQWSFSSSNSDGYFNIDTGGYGGGECIIFRPSDVGSYNSGENWRAEISGLVRISGDVSSDILSFGVTFTDALTGYESDYYLEQISRNNTGTNTQNNNNTNNNNTNNNNTNNNNTNNNNTNDNTGTDTQNNTGTNNNADNNSNTDNDTRSNTRQDTNSNTQPEQNEPPRNNSGGGSSGGGGCDTMPMMIFSWLILGIPCAMKNVARWTK